jgi:hypothetical protein
MTKIKRRKKLKKMKKAPPRIELGARESEPRMLPITPWSRNSLRRKI